MQRTILTLIAGTAIGAGTTLTLPDGETAQTVTPTAADIYNNETVSVLKLIQTEEEGKAARYVIEKTSDIEGVAPLNINGLEAEAGSAWEAVESAAKSACSKTPPCVWSSMDSARSTAETTTATVSGGPIVTITETVPALNALKAKILAEN